MTNTQKIEKSNIILLIVPKEKYHEEIISIRKSTANNMNKVCYICINEPYASLVDKFKNDNIPIERFFFVDTITKKIQAPPEVDNCIFVSSPTALTEISLAFSKAFEEKKCDCVLFDTLSTLLVYSDSHSIIQLMHNILTKLKISTGKAVFIALDDDADSELVKDLYMFVDKVIK